MAHPRRTAQNLSPPAFGTASGIAGDGAFGALFESSGEALLIVGPSGTIHRANRRARELLGIGDARQPQRELAEFLPAWSSEQLASLSCRSGLGGANGLAVSLTSGVPLRVTLRTILPGSLNLLVCLESSAADEQSAEKRASQVEAELRKIQSKMLQTEKMAALGQIVSGIAHELNNPLTAIMGYAQLLLGHGLVPQQLAEARHVYQEAERARRIVKNLLYFARENKPERSAADLNELVERTLALRSYELKVQNIVVTCDLAADIPRTMADPYQLQQVILNLVINGEQALMETRRSGQITVRTRWVKKDGGDRIVLEVSDDGPGIPAEIASRIFDPFFTTKPPGVGTGLGLSIVYGIVRQHDGDVTFESAPGSGARFCVELPVIAVPQSAQAAGPQSQRPLSQAAPGRILVVEDEPTVAQLIVDILHEQGHHAEAVLQSEEGLERLARRSYDLVICDLRMPGMDGRAFYQELERAGSPMLDRIIFVTGDTLAPSTLDFLEPNRLPHLAKPFLVEELVFAVNRQLEANRQSTPTAAGS